MAKRHLPARTECCAWRSGHSDHGICLKSKITGNFLLTHWLGICVFIAKGSDSIIGQGTNILKAMQLAKSKKNNHKDSLSLKRLGCSPIQKLGNNISGWGGMSCKQSCECGHPEDREALGGVQSSHPLQRPQLFLSPLRHHLLMEAELLETHFFLCPQAWYSDSSLISVAPRNQSQD